MKQETFIKIAVASLGFASSVASADITPGCIANFSDCQQVQLESVALISVKTCHYNKAALAPAEPGGAIQCKYTVRYQCDGKEKTSVVLSPARFGCLVED